MGSVVDREERPVKIRPMRVWLFSGLFLLFGIALLRNAWDAWTLGELVVRHKLAPSELLHRFGATSSDFYLELGWQVVAGALFGLCGAGGICVLLFAAPERRRRILERIERDRIMRRSRNRVNPWLAASIVIAFVYFIFRFAKTFH